MKKINYASSKDILAIFKAELKDSAPPINPE